MADWEINLLDQPFFASHINTNSASKKILCFMYRMGNFMSEEKPSHVNTNSVSIFVLFYLSGDFIEKANPIGTIYIQLNQSLNLFLG